MKTLEKTRRRIAASACIVIICFAVARILAEAFRVGRRGRDADLSMQGVSDASEAIASARAAMRSALIAGDLERYVAFFAHDAVSTTAAGSNIEGRDALYARLQGQRVERFVDAGFDDRKLCEIEAGAIEDGSYWLEAESDGVTIRRTGRFQTVWKRQGDSWQIASESTRAMT